MEALDTRAHLANNGDYYLGPLSKKGDQSELLAEQVTYVMDEEPDLIDFPDQRIHQITPLSLLQNRIFLLLRFSSSIYSDFVQLPPIPP